jgi:alkaline phosphatase
MKKESKIKRGIIFVLVMWVVLGLGVLETRAKDVKKEAKHIILIIGDGMNIEHEIAASRYLYGKDFELSFHKLPYQGNVATWDVTTYKYWSGGTYDPEAINPIFGYNPAQGGKRPYPLGPELPGAQAYHTAKATDSASAATAWATGYKTDDGNLA